LNFTFGLSFFTAAGLGSVVAFLRLSIVEYTLAAACPIAERKKQINLR
jgi:hypothetical protein